MTDDWDAIADWWVNEVEHDPAYEADVHPILFELLPKTRRVTMDLGCGEGQGMRLVGGDVFGCDLSNELLGRTSKVGRVARTRLPSLRWLRPDCLDTSYSVYLLDLIENHDEFFSEVARVVKPEGALAIVINHPVYTSPNSAPLVDESGEVLWRWGDYFETGSSTELAGDGEIRFFHRPLSDLLGAAARSGWKLDQMIERGLSPATIARLPGYEGQEHIPRLLGIRWLLR